MLDHPFDEELKQLVTSFAELLETHRGRRSIAAVSRRTSSESICVTWIASTAKIVRCELPEPSGASLCKERFEKNRDKLFTFLNYDGVPWNNNNAEHAIKAFARLRDVIEGMSTEKGIEEYLILLSVCQTCKYMGVDFLDFLRSGEKDIHAFAESRRGRRRRTQTSQPAGLPADAIPGTGSQP